MNDYANGRAIARFGKTKVEETRVLPKKKPARWTKRT
jgi:hypothetical protein